MIPSPFDYVRPATLDEALAALAEGGLGARAIAGGQSLLPLMKLRLARPELVVDIGRIDDLRGVRRLDDGRLAIGALTTWRELLEDERIDDYGALRDAVPTIGDVQVRNRGTLGGSLAHGDPAADIAAPMLAFDAELVARSRAGSRTIRAADLLVGPFTTALEPGELIIEVRLPPRRPGSGSAYAAVAHPASGYPVAGVAVVLGREADGAGPLDACGIAVTGVADVPYRAVEVEQAILDGTTPAEAVRAITAGRRILADPYADRAYRAAMAAVVTARALDLAAARARS